MRKRQFRPGRRARLPPVPPPLLLLVATYSTRGRPHAAASPAGRGPGARWLLSASMQPRSHARRPWLHGGGSCLRAMMIIITILMHLPLPPLRTYAPATPPAAAACLLVQ